MNKELNELGCKIMDNAKTGEYDSDSDFPERACSGDCNQCSFYYQEKRVFLQEFTPDIFLRLIKEVDE